MEDHEEKFTEKDLMQLLAQNQELMRQLAESQLRQANINEQRNSGEAAEGNAEMQGQYRGRSTAATKNMLTTTVPKYNWDADGRRPFQQWYELHGSSIGEEELPDRDKLRILIGRLGEDTLARFVSHILPTQPLELTFGDAVQKLKACFRVEKSLFVARNQCTTVSYTRWERLMSASISTS